MQALFFLYLEVSWSSKAVFHRANTFCSRVSVHNLLYPRLVELALHWKACAPGPRLCGAGAHPGLCAYWASTLPKELHSLSSPNFLTKLVLRGFALSPSPA